MTNNYDLIRTIEDDEKTSNYSDSSDKEDDVSRLYQNIFFLKIFSLYYFFTILFHTFIILSYLIIILYYLYMLLQNMFYKIYTNIYFCIILYINIFFNIK